MARKPKYDNTRQRELAPKWRWPVNQTIVTRFLDMLIFCVGESASMIPRVCLITMSVFKCTVCVSICAHFVILRCVLFIVRSSKVRGLSPAMMKSRVPCYHLPFSPCFPDQPDTALRAIVMFCALVSPHTSSTLHRSHQCTSLFVKIVITRGNEADEVLVFVSRMCQGLQHL